MSARRKKQSAEHMYTDTLKRDACMISSSLIYYYAMQIKSCCLIPKGKDNINIHDYLFILEILELSAFYTAKAKLFY